jgi:hypothetical protein
MSMLFFKDLPELKDENTTKFPFKFLEFCFNYIFSHAKKDMKEFMSKGSWHEWYFSY